MKTMWAWRINQSNSTKEFVRDNFAQAASGTESSQCWSEVDLRKSDQELNGVVMEQGRGVASYQWLDGGETAEP